MADFLLGERVYGGGGLLSLSPHKTFLMELFNYLGVRGRTHLKELRDQVRVSHPNPNPNPTTSLRASGRAVCTQQLYSPRSYFPPREWSHWLRPSCRTSVAEGPLAARRAVKKQPACLSPRD